jgi:hypothetical protein
VRGAISDARPYRVHLAHENGESFLGKVAERHHFVRTRRLNDQC